MTREEEIREASLETKIPDLSKQVIYGLGFIPNMILMLIGQQQKQLIG